MTQSLVQTARLYFNSIVIAFLSVVLLYFMHWNFASKSIWDNVYEITCVNSQNIIACSVIYGLIENLLFFTGLICSYRIICHYHWKWRYHSDIRTLINRIAENDIAENDNDNNNTKRTIEETTKGMGYNLDPLIITFPWLISPILKWNSLTNFLIHLSYYITYYYLSAPDISSAQSSPSPSPPQSQGWNMGYFEIEFNFPEIVNPFGADYSYEDSNNISLHYSVFRTLWSFVIWCILDWFLWKESYGLTYLFETGINKIMQQYGKEHCLMINNLLLVHVEYIKDLSNLIVSFHGNRLEQFLVIKVKLHECLKYFKLELLFNILTLFTVFASSLRIYYTPVMVNLINPICYVLGIVVFVTFVVVLLFNGVGSDAVHLYREFEQLFNYATQIGIIVLTVIWAIIVWKNMKKKKVALLQQQSRSLVKEILNRIYQDPKLKQAFHSFDVDATNNKSQ